MAQIKASVRAKYRVTVKSTADNHKIEAIKEFRNITKSSLRDAKDFIEGQVAWFVDESIANEIWNASTTYIGIDAGHLGVSGTIEVSPDSAQSTELDVVRKLMGIIYEVYNDDKMNRDDHEALVRLAQGTYNSVAGGKFAITPKREWRF